MKRLHPLRLQDHLERRIAADIEEGRISCASALVLQEGEPVGEVVLGHADPPRGILLERRHLFRLASMTKPVVAACALIAEDRGLFSLSDPVCRYLPAFSSLCVGHLTPEGKVATGEWVGERMQIRHLLTHTAGFGAGPVGERLMGRIPASERRTLSHAVEAYGRVMLSDFMPDATQAYSPTAGFDLAAAIVEKTAEMSIEDFLKAYITDPMGLSDLTFAPSGEQWGRMVEMHDRQNGRSVTATHMAGKIFGDMPTTYFLGGAGMVGSLSAYAAFAQMLADGGVWGGRRILSARAVKDMQTPYPPSGNVWGLGVRTVQADPYLPRGSYGWSGAYGTHFWIDPQNRIVAVYMKNSLHDGGAGAATARHFEEDVYTSFG